MTTLKPLGAYSSTAELYADAQALERGRAELVEHAATVGAYNGIIWNKGPILPEGTKLYAAPAPSQDSLDDTAYLDWVQQHNMALIPPEHGGHGWMVIHRARAVGGKFIASSENPRHDPRALRTVIKKAIDAALAPERTVAAHTHPLLDTDDGSCEACAAATTEQLVAGCVRMLKPDREME